MFSIVNLEDARREFWDAWNGLSEVHTQEALDAQSEKMWEARERLLKVDTEFRAMIKAREDNIGFGYVEVYHISTHRKGSS